jgi:hypothetical protein
MEVNIFSEEEMLMTISRLNACWDDALSTRLSFTNIALVLLQANTK